MAEDVQGATLLAVGSSSPELLTALLGVIFYPDDNPGPGTNVCSAVFNLCIIVGLSGIASPRTAKLQIIPFLRDSTTTVTHTMYNANNHSYYHGHPHTQSITSYHTQQLPSHSYGSSNSVPNSNGQNPKFNPTKQPILNPSENPTSKPSITPTFNQSGSIYIGYKNTIILSLSGHTSRIQSINKYNLQNQFISIGYD
eukprot:741536_1